MIASKKETFKILKEYNLIAKKGYGQNFLINEEIVSRIVEACDIDDNTLAIEIGPGLGALTEKLVGVSKKVVAIEIDKRLSDILKESITSDNLEVLNDDFMRVDVNKIISRNKNFSKVVIVSNLPYYITSDIIEKIIMLNNDKIDKIVVMMQKEVGKKLVKKEDKIESLLKVLIDNYCKCGIVTYVSKNDFEPRPMVDSIVLKIQPICNKYDLDDYFIKIIKECLNGRRKTLVNNLPYSKEKSIEILKELNIKENVRIEELSIEEFLKIILKGEKN